MIKVQVLPGEEIIEKITKILRKKKIKEASIVSIIGAVDSCCISTMPKEDAKKDIITEYHEPFEITGSGEIHEGKPHIHAVLGREKNIALCGHLHWARVKNWFVNIYIIS